MYDVMSRLVRPREILGWESRRSLRRKEAEFQKDICSILCLICFILIRQLGTLRIVRRLRHSLDSVDSTRLGQLPGMAETAINRGTGRYKNMLIKVLSVG